MADSQAIGEEEEASWEEGGLGNHGEDSSEDHLEVEECLRFLYSNIGCLTFMWPGALRSVWSAKI